MSEGKRRGGCLRFGCAGCAVVAIVGVVCLLVFLVLLAIGGPTRQQVEPVERRQPAPVGAGTIELDVSWADLRVHPGEPGEPIQVSGRYDTANFSLEESWDDAGDGGWRYRIEFNPKGFGLHRFIYEESENANRLDLSIPPDVPIIVTGELGPGESSLELGGTLVRQIDLAYSPGDHEISFSRPLQQPAERLVVRGGIGELKLIRVGNASPRLVDVRHRIGELTLDLRGSWVNDTEVKANCGIGECSVRVPEDINVVVEDIGVSLGEASSPRWLRSSDQEEIPGPQMRLAVRGRIGEVRVTR